MKKFFTPVILLLLAAVLIMGCQSPITTFEDGATLGADAAAETTLLTELSTDQLTETQDALRTPGSGLNIAIASALSPTTGQTITLTFNNGVIDAATVATSVFVYPLTGTAMADGAYTRGAALAFTSVISNENPGSKLILTLDLSAATISTVLEVHIKADILTANGGKLNLDGDQIMGEADQDDYFSYPTITGATVTAVGGQRNPRGTIGATYALTIGSTAATVTFTTSAGGALTDMTLASLSTGIALQKMGTDGTFTAVTLGAGAYDNTTGVLSYTITAPVAGEVYRWVTTPGSVKEATARRGYIHGLANWFWNGTRSTDLALQTTYAYTAFNAPTVFADSAAAVARADATANLASGKDFSATAKTFTISFQGGAATTVTLNTNHATLAALITDIDGQVPATWTFTQTDRNGDGTNDAFKIETTATGTGAYFTLAAGATDALADLGLTAGTYAGKAAFTGSEVAGVSMISAQNGSYAVELNFGRSYLGAAVKQSTVVPAGLAILDANSAAVPWVATSLVWLTETSCRITLPAGYVPSGNYKLKVLPTVTTAEGIPYGSAQAKDGYYYLSGNLTW